MFGLIHPTKPVKKAVGGEGGAVMPPGFSPWRRSLLPEFDRVFDWFYRDWELPGIKELVRELEVEEKPTEVVVRAEAPGFKPEEFEIEVRDECLIVHALKEKKPEVKEKAGKKEEKGEKEDLREEFREVVILPAAVAADKAPARYVNGVLIVTLPKAEGVKGRRVPVTAA
jgi:HSP20 family protein